MGWNHDCEVCGAPCKNDLDACTNRRCGNCHRKYCGEGGVTGPGHGRGNNPEVLEIVAKRAVGWMLRVFRERTDKVAAGEFCVDWVDKGSRVLWTEIHTQFPLLRSVDGRLAYDRAIKASKAWAKLWKESK